MKRIVYREEGSQDIVIAEIMSNRSITVWEALEIAGVDMDEYAAEQGWDGWDPEAIEVETVKPPKTGVNYDRLGENIRGYRLEAGLTQSDLAETIGTTQQTVQNWEQGRNMTIDSIYAVAAAIGMDNPLDLLRGVELQD